MEKVQLYVIFRDGDAAGVAFSKIVAQKIVAKLRKRVQSRDYSWDYAGVEVAHNANIHKDFGLGYTDDEEDDDF